MIYSTIIHRIVPWFTFNHWKTSSIWSSAHIPAVSEFEQAVKSDPEMVDLFEQAFIQSAPQNKIRDFDTLLNMMDKVAVSPPEFAVWHDERGNRIPKPFGLPMLRLFTYLINTSAGYDLFRKNAFNTAMKTVLDSWGQYLTTKDSAKTLTDAECGWFSEEMLLMLESEGRGKFEEVYICPDPSAVNRGFRSWDAFFVREFQPHARPVEAPHDRSVIHNPCESFASDIVRNVKRHNQFWLKGNMYSLYDLLGRDNQFVDTFVGGTIYQAFLSPQDYHRWRSPIDGTIKKIELLPGTYYAGLPDEGVPSPTDSTVRDFTGVLMRCQAWLAMVATRALVYIESDNPDIGLMCFIAVGMADVSTCEVGVKVGQRVSVGSDLGSFHFGGSSFVIVLGPHARVTFTEDAIQKKHIKVNSILARVHRG